MIPIVALTLRDDKVERKTAAFRINPHSEKWEESMCTIEDEKFIFGNEVDPASKNRERRAGFQKTQIPRKKRIVENPCIRCMPRSKTKAYVRCLSVLRTSGDARLTVDGLWYTWCISCAVNPEVLGRRANSVLHRDISCHCSQPVRHLVDVAIFRRLQRKKSNSSRSTSETKS